MLLIIKFTFYICVLIENIWFFRYINAVLLPNPPPDQTFCCTKTVEELCKPTFGDNFPLAVPLNKLYNKTLQVNVFCVDQNHQEACAVSNSFCYSSKIKSTSPGSHLQHFSYWLAIISPHCQPYICYYF